MANTIVLFAVILPAIACLPLVRLLEDLPLSLTGFDCGLSLIILTVLALADFGIASLGISQADTIHLLALAL